MDNNHDDHSTTTHSMTCPVEGCDFNIEVHAHGDDEAVQKIMAAGKVHFDEVHPDTPPMDPKEMEAATKAAMQTHA